MDALEKHRLFLYGRVGLSLALFIVAMTLGASAALTQAAGPNAILIGAFLIGAIVVLPRRSVPSGDAEEAASDEALDHFRKLRRWLTWTRLAYLLIAIGVLLGLPSLL